MSQPVAIFTPPDDFDAVALARSTRKALKVLLPWCRLSNSYVSFTPRFATFFEASYSSELTFTGSISTQALAYAKAIGFSVVAAQNGFDVAEEAVSLGNLIPISTEDQHKRYLEGMLELAKKGHDNASKTLQTFRGVREKVLAVCRLFLCDPLVLTLSGQLLQKVEPGHEKVEFKFSIHVDDQSMSILLHLCCYTYSLQ
jgi:hypothetical protein